MRPTWVEVSLAKLRQNFRNIQQHVGKDVAVVGRRVPREYSV
jgi:alanine racemase